eukprot:scaffold206948_cov17-Prasinocladus_malaysianus.AAC.1
MLLSRPASWQTLLECYKTGASHCKATSLSRYDWNLRVRLPRRLDPPSLRSRLQTNRLASSNFLGRTS